jgi:predicted ATPase
MPPIRYREDLLDHYPQPLAGTYARLFAAREPSLHYSTLLALFEVLLKYVTVAALGQYLLLPGPAPAVTAALPSLHRPSLGHWAGLLRVVLTTRRQQGLAEDQFVFPELARLYTHPTPDLPAALALVRAITGGSAATVSLRQVFDLLVAQRNDYAHGAGAAVPDRALVAHMEAALEEILHAIPSLATSSLCYVKVEDAGAEGSPPQQVRLMSDRPRLYAELLALPAGTPAPLPQRLYLAPDDTFAAAIPVHPLLVFVPACAVCRTPQVGVLNEVRNTAVEVLCYSCGHTHPLPGFAAEVAAWLESYQVRLPPEAPPPTYQVPNNLPETISSFVGRERERAALNRWLSAPGGPRLLTLIGPAGTGKTRLALTAAADNRDCFPDGVWYVELAPLTDPAQVAPTVAGVLNVPESAGQSLVTTLQQTLASKQMLLLLDNFEHLLGAAGLVPLLLQAAPGLHVLATSRRPLGVYGEQEFPIPPLTLPDLRHLPWLAALARNEAVQLFVDRAREIKPDFGLTAENAPTVAGICVRLDGLPLAIELAAAHVRLFSPAALLARLNQRLALLTGGARDRLARQQTLRGAIAWSYELLAPTEQRLFRRLAVFQGGWSLPASEAIGNAPALSPLGVAVLTGVETLVSQSLLQERDGSDGEPRLGMLETIHEFAAEQLAASGEADAVQAQHAAYFLALAEEAEPQLTGPHQDTWLTRLEEEHDNLRAALHWAGSRRAAVFGWRLAGALWRFWYTRGYWSEGREYLTTMLALESVGDDPGDQAARAKALNGAGILAAAQGDYAAAEPLYTESVSLYRTLGDEGRMANILNNLASIAFYQHDYIVARLLYEESLALSRAANNRSMCAVTLGNLGLVAFHQQDFAAAQPLYAESLLLMRDLGDQGGIAYALSCLGSIDTSLGNYTAAQARHEESLALRRHLDDKQGIANSLLNLGEVAEAQADIHTAHTFYTEYLILSRELGDQRGVLVCLESLARVAAMADPTGGGALRAAQLWSAVEAFREMGGILPSAVDRALQEQALQSARDHVEPAAWEAAWATGRALSLEQAVDLAIGQKEIKDGM